MVRQVLRKPQVLQASGYSNSTLYKKISEGRFPRPVKPDPDGRAVVWFADEIAAWQDAAVKRLAPPKEGITNR